MSGIGASDAPARTWGIRFLLAVLVALAACATAGMPMALATLTVVSLGALLTGAAHPTVAALAMTCVAVLDGHAADSLQPALATITGGLWRYNTIGFVFALFTAIGLPSVMRRIDVHTRLLFALTIVMSAGLISTSDRPHGAQFVLDVIAFVGMLFVFRRIADDPEAWYWMGVVGGTLAAGASLAYLATWSRLPHTNPNVAVFVPVTGLVAVCLALACGAPTPGRQYLLASLAVVNGLCAFLSTSRGGLLTALVCLAFILAEVRSQRRRAALIAAAVVLGMVITSFFVPLQRMALQRLTLLIDRTSAVQTRTSGRSDLVIGSWEIFKQHPFGVGTGGFESAWAGLGSVGGQRRFMRSGQRFAAHAGWTRVLVENGWIGFLILAAFVGSFTSESLRRGGRTARNVGLLATFALGVSLTTTEFHLKGLFFLAAGAAAALRFAPQIDRPPAPARAGRGPRLVDSLARDGGR